MPNDIQMPGRQMIEDLQRAGYTSRSIGQAIGLGSAATSRDYPRPQT